MGAGVRTAPGVEREPRASSRLPWAHPATFWNQNPEKLGPCSQFPLNKSPLCPWGGWALLLFSLPTSPSLVTHTSPASALGLGPLQQSQPRSLVSGPPPPSSGAHGREEHFPGGSTPLRELFAQKERSLCLTGNWEGRGESAETREYPPPKTTECKIMSKLKRWPRLPGRKQYTGAMWTPVPEHENIGGPWRATP